MMCDYSEEIPSINDTIAVIIIIEKLSPVEVTATSKFSHLT